MTNPKKMLDYIYEHEKNLAKQVYLTQPLGQGRVADYTWGQTMDQARRMRRTCKAWASRRARESAF